MGNSKAPEGWVTQPVTDTCNGRTRSGGLCKKPAGWGTDHVGTGRCKLHSGNSKGPPLKHGKYARKNCKQLKDKIEAHLADPDPMDLRGEIAFLRSLIDFFQEQIDEQDGDISQEWEKFLLIIGNIRKVAETICKIQATTLLTAADMTYVIVRLSQVLREEIQDEATLERIFGKLQSSLGISGQTSRSTIPLLSD